MIIQMEFILKDGRKKIVGEYWNFSYLDVLDLY